MASPPHAASQRMARGMGGLPGVERLCDSGAAGGRHALHEDQRRESLNSNASDEDWEVVQKRDSLAGADADAVAGRSTGAMGLPGTVLARAGDWLQWGLDGAVKGVEKTCDGIKGVWHYRRVSEERKNALELASRQQWMLMELEHERRKERDRSEKDEAQRARELEEQLNRVEHVKREKELADARLRDQMALLERASQQEKDNESLVDALKREAEQRKFQEAAALSALEELRERQHLAAEEGREKARMLEERETEIKAQQEAHERQIAELEAQLSKLKETVEHQHLEAGAAGDNLQSPAKRRSWRNSGNSDDGLPDEFFCSITLDIMQDPVLAADGFSYERAAIEDWFAKGHRTSPKTGAQMAHTELQNNLALRTLIQHAIGKKSSQDLS